MEMELFVNVSNSTCWPCTLMIVSVTIVVQLIDVAINATNAYNSSRYMNLRYILKNSRIPRATMMNTTERKQLTVSAAIQLVLLQSGLIVAQECSKICKSHARWHTTVKQWTIITARCSWREQLSFNYHCLVEFTLNHNIRGVSRHKTRHPITHYDIIPASYLTCLLPKAPLYVWHAYKRFISIT